MLNPTGLETQLFSLSFTSLPPSSLPRWQGHKLGDMHWPSGTHSSPKRQLKPATQLPSSPQSSGSAQLRPHTGAYSWYSWYPRTLGGWAHRHKHVRGIASAALPSLWIPHPLCLHKKANQQSAKVRSPSRDLPPSTEKLLDPSQL